MLGGLAPAVDGFLQRTGSCSGRVPAADGFLQRTGFCSGRVPAVDGFLQWTGSCSGQAPAAHWSLWRPVKVELIIHPRRFGKTLNMTMLRGFFDIMEESSSVD